KIENKEERTRMARHLIDLMREINPETRESEDVEKKLWDDLYIMSGFTLDVESPFPMPEMTAIGKKPQRVGEQRKEVKLRYYGRNIELLVQKAFLVTDIDEKAMHIGYIGRLMKSFYTSWNKEGITNDIVLEHLEMMTEQKISEELRNKLAEEKSFDVIPRDKVQRYDNNREKRNNIPNRKSKVNNFTNNNNNTNKNIKPNPNGVKDSNGVGTNNNRKPPFKRK
ncbi:MAG: DUF4290 domain-containing protein, partial [Bacteroidetes bacterium]